MKFVAQETRIIRKLFVFFSSKRSKLAKVEFLLELALIINESWDIQAYIFFIIELSSPISTFFDEKIKTKK